MQQLYFHPAWEKTISDKDRELIETLFENTYTNTYDMLTSPLLRAAINHKGELLVTVLVHNFTHHATTFKKRSVSISSGDVFIEQTFTIPDFIVAPFTSIPWTFIFEPNEQFQSIHLNEIELEINDF